jgi:hypothetical protein
LAERPFIRCLGSRIYVNYTLTVYGIYYLGPPYAPDGHSVRTKKIAALSLTFYHESGTVLLPAEDTYVKCLTNASYPKISSSVLDIGFSRPTMH